MIDYCRKKIRILHDTFWWQQYFILFINQCRKHFFGERGKLRWHCWINAATTSGISRVGKTHPCFLWTVAWWSSSFTASTCLWELITGCLKTFVKFKGCFITWKWSCIATDSWRSWNAENCKSYIRWTCWTHERVECRWHRICLFEGNCVL